MQLITFRGDHWLRCCAVAYDATTPAGVAMAVLHMHLVHGVAMASARKQVRWLVKPLKARRGRGARQGEMWEREC